MKNICKLLILFLSFLLLISVVWNYQLSEDNEVLYREIEQLSVDIKEPLDGVLFNSFRAALITNKIDVISLSDTFHMDVFMAAANNYDKRPIICLYDSLSIISGEEFGPTDTIYTDDMWIGAINKKFKSKGEKTIYGKYIVEFEDSELKSELIFVSRINVI